jgi:hypothetical protein
MQFWWGVMYADLLGTDQASHTPRWMVWAGPTFCFAFSLFFFLFSFSFVPFLFTFFES